MRKIDFLRKQYGGTWKYSPSCHNWFSEDLKVTVEPRSLFSPQYHGDDTSYVTVYYMYDSKGAPKDHVFFP